MKFDPKIQHSTSADLQKLAECHKRAFRNSLSSKQGNRFRSKMLEWYILSDRGVMFHICDGDQIVAYCGGIITTEPGMLGAISSISQYAFNDFVLSYLLRPWLLFHPENLKKWRYILRNILCKFKLRKAKNGNKVKKENFRPFMGLVVIGVDPNYQRMGLGTLLLQEFELLGRKNTVHHIQLSVISSNLQAINAYQKNGWVIKETHSTSYLLSKDL